MDPAVERTDGTARSCPHCGRPFARERYRTLHVGLEHYETLTEADREAFVEEYEGESDEIRRFRLKALAALIAMYFAFLFLYLAIA